MVVLLLPVARRDRRARASLGNLSSRSMSLVLPLDSDRRDAPVVLRVSMIFLTQTSTLEKNHASFLARTSASWAPSLLKLRGPSQRISFEGRAGVGRHFLLAGGYVRVLGLKLVP